jgi:hypothetical protein
MIELRKKYKVESKSSYLHGKYGDDIIAWVEDTDDNIWGSPWYRVNGNWATSLYGARVEPDSLPSTGLVYYTKIQGMGELIHESEFGEKAE